MFLLQDSEELTRPAVSFKRPTLFYPLQLLVRLCSHPYPAEELARKDDLTLLFSAITSWCPQYNVMWRKSAAEVLMTLSRHGLTQNVVAYIHSEFRRFDRA